MKLAIFALSFILVCDMAVAADDPSSVCSKRIAADPKFSALAQKVPLDLHMPTLEMLADGSYPTPADRKSIGQWMAAEKSCIKQGDTYRHSHYPHELIALAANAEARITAVALALYNDQIQYGTANQELLAIYGDVTAQYDAIVERLNAEHAAHPPAAPAAPAPQ